MQNDKDAAIRVFSNFASKVNFAGHQNAVPLLRELKIENNTEVNYQDLRLSISSHPAFLKERIWAVDRLSGNSTVNIPDSLVEYDASMLFALNEAINADIHLKLTNIDNEVIYEKMEQVRVLAKNEWGGSHFIPELLAAFIQPNDSFIQTIQKQAAELLHRKDIIFDGYKSGSSENAWSMLASIWNAIASLKLDYALPPASFESLGQKIRTPSQISLSGLATCLDSTLLFASAIEAVGLHPIVVLIKGHACVGAWLTPEEFKSVIVDDVVAVRKAVGLDKLVLIETTLAVKHPPATFSQAVKKGADSIAEHQEAAFNMVIDVKRARIQKISPLPTIEPIPSSGVSTEEFSITLDIETPPVLPRFDIEHEDIIETPQTRLNRWQRKLLDLSLRNKLLNFKPSKKAIMLLCNKPAVLEDLLADGKEIRLSPLPDLGDGKEGRDEAVYSQMHSSNLTEEFINEALERSLQVYAPLSKEILESSLIELFRQAKLDIGEGGANTLFLAIGFLAWKKDAKDPKRYKAPLILIPVILTRQGVNADMKLKIHDDEPRFNSSLMEMLKQDFEIQLPNLEILPRDNFGIHVQEVWDKIKIAVHDVPGFEVVPEVALSTFSFAKYLMWKDLVDRTDQLKKSKIVAHLIDTPREAYSSGIEFIEPNKLDDNLHPNAVFCPLPMDSSQLAAVIAAEKGKDFVLIGPPGTGKSQTIANMIAHLLASNKTVLFVAEKSEALNVVYRRMSQQELGEFCLELHSNKSKKSEVLAQLRKAWEVSAEHVQSDWISISDDLKVQRDKLNGFVRHLHNVHSNGFSAYQAIGMSSLHEDLFVPTLFWLDINSHTVSDYKALINLCDEMTVALQSAGGLENSSLQVIKADEWSPSWQSQLIESANRLANAAIRTERSLDKLAHELGINLSVKSREAFEAGVEFLIKGLSEISTFHLIDEITDELLSLRHNVEAAQLLQADRNKLISKLSVPYQKDIEIKVDVEQLVLMQERSSKTWWPKSRFSAYKLKSILRPFTTTTPNLINDVPLINLLHENRLQFNKVSHIGSAFQLEWNEFETDFKAILQKLELAGNISNECNKNEASVDSIASYKQRVSIFLSMFGKMVSERLNAGIKDRLSLVERLTGAIKLMRLPAEQAKIIDNSVQQFLTDIDLLAPHTTLGAANNDAFNNIKLLKDELFLFDSLAIGKLGEGSDQELPWLSYISKTVQTLVTSSTSFKNWCDWQKYKKMAVAKGLQPLVAAAESKLIPIERLKDAFELGYAKWWLNKLIDQDEVLRKFSSSQHERIIDKFKKLDDEYQALTKKFIRSRLASNKPSTVDSQRNNEFGVLQKELTKKSKHIPLRTLITKMPTGLTQLTPCLLMSPLSVAQYLPTDQALFDVVIFDEASQITVWDAVGAIARGKQAIIVGDPKQLPPTSFFGRTDNDGLDGDVADVDDLESILDEALGSRISKIDLQWHYRSLHESLIAFSNHKYYGDKLVTFPSPATVDAAVKFVEVSNGAYDKGGTRTNKAEAEAITVEVLKRLNDWKSITEKDRPSIGVVTFNSEQQSLIENMIETEVRKFPDLAWFFSEDCLEPVLVKNIENIQGDQRDVMLFSITYGPDQAGKISMNFGPMNRDGGERRLNVAITRAKREMIVFSTLSPEKIDLTRTQSIGVRDLKHFLEYAKRGPSALSTGNKGSVGTYDSIFEIAVADALTNKGWRVIPQIGVSAYRIDLGIVRPDNPGEFLCGVECDGATYHRSATARDRDKLREQILCGLGWSILRVWSTDWWIDSKGATERIHKELTVLLNKKPKTEKREAVFKPLEESKFAEDDELNVGKFEECEIYAKPSFIGSSSSSCFYLAADFSSFDRSINSGKFFDEAYTATIKKIVDEIITREAPIRKDILMQKISKLHGWQRTGARIQERLNPMLSSLTKTVEGELEFIWLSSEVPFSMPFRKHKTAEEKRSSDKVPLQELLGIAENLAITLSNEEFVMAMAEQMEIARITEKTRLRLLSVRQELANLRTPPTTG